MASEFDIRPMVQENSALPIERLRVASRSEDIRLSEIRRGVVFVFAAWSSPAVLALRSFTRLLGELPAATLDLVILDIDCLTPESAARLFGKNSNPLGYGETIWVRDGVITATELAAFASEQTLYNRLAELLQ